MQAAGLGSSPAGGKGDRSLRAVVQRCSRAKVTVDGKVTGEIGPGLVVLLGVGNGDGEADASYLAEKTANLRVFEDADGKMNLSVLDAVAGRTADATGRDGSATEPGPGRAEALVVSQFTLYGDCRRGRRPGFSDAAAPAEADRLYREYVRCLEGYGVHVETGVFQAMMQVELVNDGPVTILLDSRKLF